MKDLIALPIYCMKAVLEEMCTSDFVLSKGPVSPFLFIIFTVITLWYIFANSAAWNRYVERDLFGNMSNEEVKRQQAKLVSSYFISRVCYYVALFEGILCLAYILSMILTKLL